MIHCDFSRETMVYGNSEFVAIGEFMISVDPSVRFVRSCQQLLTKLAALFVTTQ